MTDLAATRVLLGVSGGIAAYKAAELVRRLREAGAEVRVVMTDGAQHFVTPLTFQALSGNPVRTSLWDEGAEAAMGHIELARWANRILVAPATANVIARLAGGMADDLLTTLCLASAAPLAIAPAMNQQMWAHAATRANIATLYSRGVVVLGPDSGSQACGDVGEGRMLEPGEIVAALLAMPRAGALAGVRFVVSAGPTYEDIDPVRYICNRSSGRIGFAIADAAALAGADVTLVAGPVVLPTPARVKRIDVRSARSMREAVLAAVEGADVFVSAAAVADYGPAEIAAQKIKKGAAAQSLQLVPTPDILAEVSARPGRPLLIGFAAETEDVERHARDKLERKRLDLIAANRVGEEGLGFESDENAITLYWRGGQRELGRAPKRVLATLLVDEIAARLGARPAAAAAAGS